MRGWLRVKQGELFFESAGQGEPVVFLHGFGLDSRMWIPQLQALQSKVRVIQYDLRGFGRSPLPPVDKYAHEDDLKVLLLHLDVKSAHVVGLSIGGRMALSFAAAYPQMVQSLVLADSGPSLVISGSRDIPDFQAIGNLLAQGLSGAVTRSSKEQDIWSIWRH